MTPSRPMTTFTWISVGTIEKENIFLLWSLNFRMLAWGSTFSESEATSGDSSVKMKKSNQILMALSASLVPGSIYIILNVLFRLRLPGRHSQDYFLFIASLPDPSKPQDLQSLGLASQEFLLNYHKLL